MREDIEELRFQKVFLANLEDLNPKHFQEKPPDTLTTLVLLV